MSAKANEPGSKAGGLDDLRRRSDAALEDSSKPLEASGLRPAATSIGAAALMRGTLIDAEARVKAAEKRVGRAMIVKLSDLISVPGRRRTLSADEYRSLLENLRHNDLVTPVTVRETDVAGKFEILSGDNRVAVYRELGRDSIEIVIKDFEGETAEKAAFFANLLQPNLPDYEKFIGFSKLLAEQGATQESVSRASGVKRPVIARIMGFGFLPETIHVFLRQHTRTLSFNSLPALRAAISAGASVEQLVEKLGLVASGEMTQTEFGSYLRSLVAPRDDAGQSFPVIELSGIGRIERGIDRISIAFSPALLDDELTTLVTETLSKLLREHQKKTALL